MAVGSMASLCLIYVLYPGLTVLLSMQARRALPKTRRGIRQTTGENCTSLFTLYLHHSLLSWDSAPLIMPTHCPLFCRSKEVLMAKLTDMLAASTLGGPAAALSTAPAPPIEAAGSSSAGGGPDPLILSYEAFEIALEVRCLFNQKESVRLASFARVGTVLVWSLKVATAGRAST